MLGDRNSSLSKELRPEIRYLDLGRLHRDLKPELMAAFETALDEGHFILGKSVEDFERVFSEFSGSKFCLGVSSGTSALHLALEASGIGPGDQVIVPVNSFTATAAAVLRSGASPVFVDVDSETNLITPEIVLDRLTPETRAIIPVHLHGNVVDVGGIRQAVGAEKVIIEDCAQAHGAKYYSLPVGSYSDAACYSFYPGKNLGALGDAGAIATNRKDVAEAVLIQRSWGKPRAEGPELLGYNERLDALQAKFLTVKLEKMSIWEGRRREIAERYFSNLSNADVVGLPDRRNPGRVWHVFAIQVPNRDKVQVELARLGVETRIHYQTIISEQRPYERFATSNFPNALRQVRSQLSLPIDPLMSEDEVDFVSRSVLDALSATS